MTNNAKLVYYNYQGDVREIAQGMEVAVNTLFDLNKSQGGDGKVDIVAHSLGNLVTRQYLLTHKDNHKIRRYIAVGAPFKGSWVMDLDAGIKSIPGIGNLAEKRISNLAVAAARDVGILNDKKQPISQYSVAAQQVRSDSDFLKELNKPEDTPKDVKFYALYGDVNATFENKIFNHVISKKASVGDFLILPDSATYLPGTNPNLIAYTDSVTLKASVVRAASGVELSFPSANSIKYAHNNMLSQPEIKEKIKSILASE